LSNVACPNIPRLRLGLIGRRGANAHTGGSNVRIEAFLRRDRKKAERLLSSLNLFLNF
jgi:hypothetical protein